MTLISMPNKNKKNDAELEKEIKPSALNPSVPFESRRGKEKEAYSFRFSDTHLRTHSLKGISRAKIKSVKMTITVICCYIICSTPFIAALLWSAYDPYAKEHPFFYGEALVLITSIKEDLLYNDTLFSPARDCLPLVLVKPITCYIIKIGRLLFGFIAQQELYCSFSS